MKIWDTDKMFERAKKFAPSRPRARAPFAPHRIDARKFIVDRVRPFPEWPLICREANLPAYDDKSHSERFMNCNVEPVNFHRTRTLVEWNCSFCGKFHVWTAGSHTDTGGGKTAGSDRVPDRIQRLAGIYFCSNCLLKKVAKLGAICDDCRKPKI